MVLKILRSWKKIKPLIKQSRLLLCVLVCGLHLYTCIARLRLQWKVEDYSCVFYLFLFLDYIHLKEGVEN